jgi:hypothetical protein
MPALSCSSMSMAVSGSKALDKVQLLMKERRRHHSYYRMLLLIGGMLLNETLIVLALFA